MKKSSRQWRLLTGLLLLLLFGVGFFWSQQLGSVIADSWLWEDQLEMELAMAKAAQASPATVPEIDRLIPETETALFALG